MGCTDTYHRRIAGFRTSGERGSFVQRKSRRPITAKMSCRTKASRSAGARVSSTTISAGPTESASRAWASGSLASSVGGSTKMSARGCSRRPRAGAQHPQALPGHYGGQPSAQILHIGGVSAGQTQPRVLHGVVGFGEGAEHPVGDGAQMGLLLLETRCQPVVLIHRSHSPVVVAHSDESSDCVTGHKWSYRLQSRTRCAPRLLGGAGRGRRPQHSRSF